MPEHLPTIVCLMGPTASGKTDLAVRLVETLPMDIISVDSAMVYKGMDIGTAKPDAETLRRAPHRLIDFLDPADAYSAARFCEDAMREIHTIIEAGRTPLLVGGTMMYFRSLLQGMANLPSADESVRADLAAEAEAVGWQALHQQLASVDPQAAARIHPNDPQRISRALEVYRLTGVPLSEWMRQPTQSLPFRPVLLGLVTPDRAVLHQRIAQRFEHMLKNGFIDEVAVLYQRADLSLDTPAIRSVGYRQAWLYLDGQLAYAEMLDKAVAATRQLAKRQLTWLRSMPGVLKIDFLNNNLDAEALKLLSKIHIN
ncbi:MAG: tRNA (adenosine(37)-N6)-dimethylallyltransferase MiaA [Gammaproteobacteria bacterium]|jgi:tRNA dimethylallyltransferase